MKYLFCVSLLLVFASASSSSDREPVAVYLNQTGASALQKEVSDGSLHRRLKSREIDPKLLVLVESRQEPITALVLPEGFVERWNKEVRSLDTVDDDQYKLCMALFREVGGYPCPGRVTVGSRYH